eukprot:Opistho-2@63242
MASPAGKQARKKEPKQRINPYTEYVVVTSSFATALAELLNMPVPRLRNNQSLAVLREILINLDEEARPSHVDFAARYTYILLLMAGGASLWSRLKDAVETSTNLHARRVSERYSVRTGEDATRFLANSSPSVSGPAGTRDIAVSIDLIRGGASTSPPSGILLDIIRQQPLLCRASPRSDLDTTPAGLTEVGYDEAGRLTIIALNALSDAEWGQLEVFPRPSGGSDDHWDLFLQFLKDCKAAGAPLSLLPSAESEVQSHVHGSTVRAAAGAPVAGTKKQIKIPTRRAKTAQPLELRDLWSFLKDQFEFMSTMTDVEKWVIYDRAGFDNPNIRDGKLKCFRDHLYTIKDDKELVDLLKNSNSPDEFSAYVDRVLKAASEAAQQKTARRPSAITARPAVDPHASVIKSVKVPMVVDAAQPPPEDQRNVGPTSEPIPETGNPNSKGTEDELARPVGGGAGNFASPGADGNWQRSDDEDSDDSDMESEGADVESSEGEMDDEADGGDCVLAESDSDEDYDGDSKKKATSAKGADADDHDGAAKLPGWIDKIPEVPDIADVTINGTGTGEEDDQAIVRFFLLSGAAKLWNGVMRAEEKLSKEGEGYLERIEKITDKYVGKVREAQNVPLRCRDFFLKEYTGVVAIMKAAFHRDAPLQNTKFRTWNEVPAFMQALTAYRLTIAQPGSNERVGVGNWSSPGAGKTIAAILSCLCVSSSFSGDLTPGTGAAASDRSDVAPGFFVIFCPNAGGELPKQWKSKIAKCIDGVPDSNVVINCGKDDGATA